MMRRARRLRMPGAFGVKEEMCSDVYGFCGDKLRALCAQVHSPATEWL